MTVVMAAPVDLPARIAHLRRLQRGGNDAAVIAEAERLVPLYPENRDLLLLLAASLRMAGRIDEVMATLDRLAAAHPRFSLLWQERGLAHVARREASAAIAALLEAVNINPALPASWRMLESLYRLVGDPANAATAAGHVAALAAQHPDVVRATSLFADGDLAGAEDVVRAVLRGGGDDPEAMRLLARIGMALDVLDDAEALLAAVLAQVPGHRPARRDYAECLLQRHKYAQARAEVDRLLVDEPQSVGLRAMAATAAIGLGDQERAISLYRGLIGDAPGSADFPLFLGHALKTVGRVADAVEAYRAAAARRSDYGDAYWSLANLKRYRFEDGEIAAMRAAEAAPATAEDDRIHLRFALGKALEDCGDHAGAWRFYKAGNALKRQGSRYRPELLEANTRAQREHCTPAFFAARAGWGAPERDPVFVVGLPRSGSTLVEQILASHSQVEGTQELPDIQRLVLELQGRDPDLDRPRYPANLADLSAAQVRALGQRYLDDTRVYRIAGRPLFVDKMPNNFRHIGLIHLILPHATIIDVRREPMSCCFSNLKQLFAQGQEFTYSVEDIARYYRTYLDLMEHWDEALPGRVMRVQHEDLIEDLEGSVRRLLDGVGLPFEQGCIDFHQTRRSVRTPSSEQVRQPIFREGFDQWRHYAEWLAPLRDALGDALVRYRPERDQP